MQNYSSLKNHLSIPYEQETPPDDTILKALCDDLNTPKALSELSQLCKKLKTLSDKQQVSKLKNKIISSGKLMGLLQESNSDFLNPNLGDQENKKINALILDRNNARKNKDYKKADAIRAELDELGIILEDNNNQTIWRKK